jgi:exopolysaccharide biosynthesis polyprenyl glycosylphosphotransferase
MRTLRTEPMFLLLGDLVVLYVSLWLTLLFRYLEVPPAELWVTHAAPFTLLFAMTVVVYFIAGLYDQHTSFVRSRLPSLVGFSQIVTVVLAALFFFSVPYFGITPKTILLIFLAISSLLMVVWRLMLAWRLGVRSSTNALVLGRGKELETLVRELNTGNVYGLRVQHMYAPSDVQVSAELQEQIRTFITRENIQAIIVDTRDPNVRHMTSVFYNLLFLHPNLMVLDALQLYENLFKRMPISMLEDAWFIEHITRQPAVLYNLYHRTFDIVVSFVLGLVTLVLLPFIALAIKLDDGGPILSFQRRVGKDNQPLDLVKFRTMTDANDKGKWGATENRVTRVGNFLRMTRIDELPQLWNVLVGGYSLIGPRPEFPDAVKQYADSIPYYNARHLITPGLSGWAQLNHHEHPHHGVDVAETQRKLSYDLYYLKNRSVWLDLEIGLKTIKTLLSALGK